MSTGSDELFVTCLNDNNENKIVKPIKNYLDLFINTRFIHLSIRSCLVSRPKIKLISNREKLFNAKDLSPNTSIVIFPPNPCGKIPTNSQINPGTTNENKISKVRTTKILLDSGAIASILRKDVLCKCRINGRDL